MTQTKTIADAGSIPAGSTFLEFDMTINFLYGFLCALLGHTGVWYCYNSQLVWSWWADKVLLPNVIFGIPAGVAFWYSTKYLMVETNALWSVRFLAFAASYFIFPVLTWFHLGESAFTVKTIACTVLALLMISIQVFVK